MLYTVTSGAKGKWYATWKGGHLKDVTVKGNNPIEAMEKLFEKLGEDAEKSFTYNSKGILVKKDDQSY